jgi:hypothetical protein
VEPSKEARHAKYATAEVRTANIRLYLDGYEYARLKEWAKERGLSRLRAFEEVVAAGLAAGHLTIAAQARRGANA